MQHRVLHRHLWKGEDLRISSSPFAKMTQSGTVYCMTKLFSYLSDYFKSKLAGGTHGWTRSSWLNSPIKSTRTRGRSRIGWGGRNIETLSKHAGMGLGKLKPIWSWFWQGTWRATRKVSIGTSSAKGWLGRMGVCPVNGNGDPVLKDMEKAEALIAAFVLVFTGKTSHQLLRPVGKCRARKTYSQWGRIRLGSI